MVKLAEQAEQIASGVELPLGKHVEMLRRLVREAIAATDAGQQIENEVAALLEQAAS